jgi:nucleotide-binding universal stress UspA family protein
MTADAMSHILCIVDGSEPACRAARKAVTLAVALGSDLTFVAFATPGRLGPALRAYREAEGLQGELPLFLNPAAEDCLDIALRHAKGEGQRNLRRLVRAGAPRAGIGAAVAEVGADTVVLGRNTGTGMARLRALPIDVVDRTQATVVLVG